MKYEPYRTQKVNIFIKLEHAQSSCTN